MIDKEPDKEKAALPEKLSSKDFLELVWKIAAGLSVACYLVGSIVVNIHFRRFGYYSLSLANAQYLVAGMWALVPVAFGWFFVFIVLLKRPGLLPELRSTRMQVIAAVVTIVGVVVFGLLTMSSRIEGYGIIWRLLILLGAAFFLTVPTAAFLRWITPFESLTSRWIPLTVICAFLAGVAALLYFQAFARSLYGEIPGTLGGGRPRLMRLVVRSEVKQDMIEAGINFPKESRTSGLLKLLTATEKEYIVLTPTGDSSIGIRTDAVQAVLYQPEND